MRVLGVEFMSIMPTTAPRTDHPESGAAGFGDAMPKLLLVAPGDRGDLLLTFLPRSGQVCG
ncbi:hypothetical protein [Rhodococcus tukisamuensis]|uniref:hypothetical protein n=1 Tax=Rhodococcus tukisamuensis TaxID=168276 RepID=UPI0009325570|nr:hypothetical protein [Rhodococcus tukisamuensis]